MIQYIGCTRRSPLETNLPAEGATLVRFSNYLAEVHLEHDVEWL